MVGEIGGSSKGIRRGRGIVGVAEARNLMTIFVV